jgi:DNA processing protein
MSVVRPRACPACLRRAWLIGSLSAHIETAVDDRKGSRAHEILALPDEELARAMARDRAGSYLDRSASREAERLRAAVAGVGAWACCRHDDLYPAGLRDLGDGPGALFGRGDPALLSELTTQGAVTIVGSRRPSGYGLEMATTLGREVASSALVVVSGMALGIDAAAHRGALEAGGTTVAVLGSGVDVPYPPRHARLYEQIVEVGLILGELPPGTVARRWTFPARNRIMAALGGMTVVVEARDRSGSLITAEMADDLGRDVGAVPGRVGSSSATGANNLLRSGAHVIRGGADVLDSLLGVGAGERLRGHGPALDPDLAELLALVERGAATPDALARASKLEPGPLAAALVKLELSGYLGSDSAGRYERTMLAAPESTRSEQ